MSVAIMVVKERMKAKPEFFFGFSSIFAWFSIGVWVGWITSCGLFTCVVSSVGLIIGYSVVVFKSKC